MRYNIFAEHFSSSAIILKSVAFLTCRHFGLLVRNECPYLYMSVRVQPACFQLFVFIFSILKCQVVSEKCFQAFT